MHCTNQMLLLNQTRRDSPLNDWACPTLFRVQSSGMRDEGLAFQIVCYCPTRLGRMSLAMIGVSYFVLEDTMPYPSYPALLPCLGATCMQNTCSMRATYMQNTCSIHATYMQDTCKIHPTCIQHVCSTHVCRAQATLHCCHASMPLILVHQHISHKNTTVIKRQLL